MECKIKLIERKNKFNEYVTDPKRVRRYTIVGLIIFILFLVIAVLIAHFFDPEVPPDGYNIMIHYISDLGSVRYTSVPVLLNILWMGEAILFTPLVFYLYKKIHVSYKEKEKWNMSRIGKVILINVGFLFMIIGLIGWFWVGFFSEDEGRLLEKFGIVILGLNFHEFFSLVVFGGFVFAGIFIGLFFMLYPKTTVDTIRVKIPWILIVILGLVMMIWPLFHGAGFLLGWLPSRQFHEWFMLFALMAWLYPIGCIAIKMINNELSSRE